MTDLSARIQKHLPTEGFCGGPLPDICLFRVEADHPLIPLVYDPCVVFVAQGEKEAWLENKQFRYNASNYLLLTVPLPLRCRVINTEPNKPFLAVRLNLNLSVIRELLHDEVCMLEESDQSVIGMETSAITEPLNTRLVKLLDTMDKPSHIASQANRHYREIMRLLLQGPQARMLRNFAITDRQCNRIALAINYIHQHFSKSLCIEQLADVAAMSPSSFHEHFKNVTQFSPKQYLKNVRLHQAKHQIFVEQTAVSEAAYRVGYESPSQFSREYKRLFGLPPTEHLRQAS